MIGAMHTELSAAAGLVVEAPDEAPPVFGFAGDDDEAPAVFGFAGDDEPPGLSMDEGDELATSSSTLLALDYEPSSQPLSPLD
jgi:hypothetical protein